MSAETPEHGVGSPDEINADSIDLDNVFAQPTRDEWLISALASLPNHDSLDSLCRKTLDGLTIQVLYDAYAGGPITSGLRSEQTEGSWDNRLCLIDNADAATNNRKVLEGLNGGNSSLQINWKTTTDLQSVLNGVKLDLLPVSLRAGNRYAQAAENYHSIVNTQAVDKQKVQCSFNADPVGSWLTGESETQPDRQAFTSMAVFSKTVSQQFALAHTILVDATRHHNAGASTQQELTACIATAALYLEALLAQGFSVEQASHQIVFQVACDADVLMGIVKLRSLKGLWHHLLGEFAATNNTEFAAHATSFNLVVETSKRYLTRLDHWNNHLRNIAACTAAAMASATTILVHPHDQVDDWSASEDPSLGERIARNLPIILDRECGLTKVSDPTAGSFAIESLSQKLMEATWQRLSELNTGDDWIASLASGQWQKELTQTHERRIQRLRDESRVMVGVNRFREQGRSVENSVTSNHTIPAQKTRLRPVRDAEEFEYSSISSTATGVSQ